MINVMYRLPPYEYMRPMSLEEAIKLLSELRDAKILAGGTDLLVDLKIGRARPRYIIDITGIRELRFIEDTSEAIRIGALTTIQDLLESRVIETKTPLIKRVAEKFAYWQIRNRATIAGNICNASPASDLAPALLVYEAVVRVTSVRGERYIPITEFFIGPRQVAMDPDELVIEVIVPYRVLENAGFSYVKTGRRQGHDISVVAVATALKIIDDEIIDARIALNSVAPRPIRARSVEKALLGRRPRVVTFREASELVSRDISPITDVRAPAEYRAHLAKLLVYETLIDASRKATRCGFE